MTTLTLSNFKDKMIAKAKKAGHIWENFGQAELSQLKDKYIYSPYTNQWSAPKERRVYASIQELDNWACRFDLSQLN